jgi:hypothetical protein
MEALMPGKMSRRSRGSLSPGMLDFENTIEKGGDEFMAQTTNGTAKWRGTGWNKGWDYDAPQVEPDATRPAGRSNRTGE